MIRLVAVILGPLLLASCAATPVVPAQPEPPPEGCDVACRQPCTADGISLELSPGAEDAFDQLVLQVVIPLRARLQECSDVHRGACVQCLDRLQAEGVTR